MELAIWEVIGMSGWLLDGWDGKWHGTGKGFGGWGIDISRGASCLTYGWLRTMPLLEHPLECLDWDTLPRPLGEAVILKSSSTGYGRIPRGPSHEAGTSGQL